MNLSITEQSMQNCMTLSPDQMCSLYVNVPAGSKPGSFGVKASASVINNQQSKLLDLFDSNVNSTVQTTVGLTALQYNTNNGIDGIVEFNDNAVSLSNESSGIAIITFVVASPNSGVFNTIDLVDAQHNSIPYQVLSNNSGNGLTALSNGDVVTLAVNIPSGATQLSFYPALMEL